MSTRYVSKFVMDPVLWLYGASTDTTYRQRLMLKLPLIFSDGENILQYVSDQTQNATQEEIETWIAKRHLLYEYPDCVAIRTRAFDPNDFTPRYPFLMMSREEITSSDWMVDFITHYTMRALASTSPKLQRWVARREADLFLKRYYLPDLPELTSYQRQVLKWLLGSVVTFNNNVVIVPWWMVLHHLEKRPWFFLEKGKLRLDMRREDARELFDHLIHQRAYDLFLDAIRRYQMTPERKKVYAPIAENLRQMVVIDEDYTTTFEEVDTVLAKSPMCIYDLDQQIRAGVDIGYINSVELSFYMKAFLGFDDLKRYWWAHNANNNHFASAEEMFASPQMAQLNNHLRHQYQGSVDAGNGYDAMRCSTAQDSYTCYFRDNTPDEIELQMRARYAVELADAVRGEAANEILTTMINATRANKYCFACSQEWALRLLLRIPWREDIPFTRKNYFEILQGLVTKLHYHFAMWHPIISYYRNMHGILHLLNPTGVPIITRRDEQLHDNETEDDDDDLTVVTEEEAASEGLNPPD